MGSISYSKSSRFPLVSKVTPPPPLVYRDHTQPSLSVPYLGGEAAVADGALERPLLGVTAVVDLQGGVAGERLEADVTRRVPSHCSAKHTNVRTQQLLLQVV